jgi:hypothetical protein
MRKVFFVMIIILSAIGTSYAQDYVFYTRQADSLYNKGYYQKAADTYKQAVNVHSNINDNEKDPFFWNVYEGLLNCYNNMSMTDSVFKYMEVAIMQGNSSYQLFTNSRFYREYSDPRMNRLMALSDSIYIKNNPTADHEVGLVLRHMRLEDHVVRQEMEIMEIRKVGKRKMDSIYAVAMRIDSMNMIRLVPILEKYGYPSVDVVGNDFTAITTPLVVLQHADLKYQKKYYRLVKKAASTGDIPMFSYAFITDQILVAMGKKQLYGTQYRYNEKGQAERYPIKNPKQLHQRLATANLE